MVPSALSNDPAPLCDPQGFPRILLHNFRTSQIVQTPNQVLVLYQFNHKWRNIWADGRALPFTVEQFVLMGRYPYLSPFSSISRDDRRAVREAMERTGTAVFADRMLGTLSGGWRIVHTMGSKITKLQPVGGFAAETQLLVIAIAVQAPVHDTPAACVVRFVF